LMGIISLAGCAADASVYRPAAVEMWVSQLASYLSR
jgi:hypothetical protein